LRPTGAWVKNYAASVEPGATLLEGPYIAETFEVTVDNDYIVLDV
jgi:3-phenylpropionate/trans-cinnamate dioxygenase ferredoxin subunit